MNYNKEHGMQMRAEQLMETLKQRREDVLAGIACFVFMGLLVVLFSVISLL